MAWLATVSACLAVIEFLVFCTAYVGSPRATAICFDVSQFLAVVTEVGRCVISSGDEVNVHCIRSQCFPKARRRCLELGFQGRHVLS
jgi:hypothetical protein